MHRSYLFAPGHNPNLLAKVFDAGADAVILDLEDAVPPDAKAPRPRDGRRQHCAEPRLGADQRPRTDIAEADLAAVGASAYGIRIPKVETVDDVRWVADRAPGKPLLCAIESAKGVVNALAIAAEPSRHPPRPRRHRPAKGPRRRLRRRTAGLRALPPRRRRRAAGIAPTHRRRPPPPARRRRTRRQAKPAETSACYGKSAIHPRQLPTIHAAFNPTTTNSTGPSRSIDAFETAGGDAVQLPTGEFVDLPVAERARAVLAQATVK